ncbi:MAG: hypothetical protein KF712_13385 [Akkermansiaceae bacterium]|nr:hypothetical protein [Akkermansiaceae bacterium]
MHRTDQPLWITPADFRAVLSEADSRLSVLRGRYPSLGPYPVLARGGLQTEPTNDLPKLVGILPDLFADNPAKSEILGLLGKKGETRKPGKLRAAEKKNQEARIGELSPLLRIDGSFRVELRFGNLDYESIWKLKADPLVDQELTLRSHASIRIVLMPLSAFVVAGPSNGAR